MKQRYILVKREDGGGELVPANRYAADASNKGPMVIGDIKTPFLSMADGKTMITSKAQYRDHLRAHGCVEVGSSTSFGEKRKAPPVGPILKDIYHAARDRNYEVLNRIAESGKITN